MSLFARTFRGNGLRMIYKQKLNCVHTAQVLVIWGQLLVLLTFGLLQHSSFQSCRDIALICLSVPCITALQLNDLSVCTRTCWGWCGSSSFFRIPSLKFVRLAVRKIWRTMCVSINGPGDLELWPFDLETGVRVASKVGNLRAELGHARPLGSRIISYVRNGRTNKSNAYSPLPYTSGGIIITAADWTCVGDHQSESRIFWWVLQCLTDSVILIWLEHWLIVEELF